MGALFGGMAKLLTFKEYKKYKSESPEQLCIGLNGKAQMIIATRLVGCISIMEQISSNPNQSLILHRSNHMYN